MHAYVYKSSNKICLIFQQKQLKSTFSPFPSFFHSLCLSISFFAVCTPRGHCERLNPNHLVQCFLIRYCLTRALGIVIIGYLEIYYARAYVCWIHQLPCKRTVKTFICTRCENSTKSKSVFPFICGGIVVVAAIAVFIFLKNVSRDFIHLMQMTAHRNDRIASHRWRLSSEKKKLSKSHRN